MITLNGNTEKIRIFLGGAVTTNQLQWSASYAQTDADALDTYDGSEGVTSDTTEVDVVAGVSAKQVSLKSLSVYNADTVPATVTIVKDVSGTNTVLYIVILASGAMLHYEDGAGWSTTESYRPIKEYIYHKDAGANWTLTNATNAERFALNAAGHQILVNAKGYTQVRFLANIVTASASVNTPKIRLRYYTAYSGTFANFLQIGASAQADISVFTGTAGTLGDTGWIDLAAGAQVDGISLAVCELGGDGAADPALGTVLIWFR